MIKRKIRELLKKASPMLLPAVLFLALFYALSQTFTGDRSLFSWFKLRAQVSDIKEVNLELGMSVNNLQEVTDRLNPRSLDEDFLDEQIRRSLPMVKKGEGVVFIDKK